MSTIIKFVGGMVVGAILTGAATWIMMPKLMIHTHESRLGFEQTVEALQTAAQDKQWLIPKVYDLQASLKKEGFTDMS